MAAATPFARNREAARAASSGLRGGSDQKFGLGLVGGHQIDACEDVLRKAACWCGRWIEDNPTSVRTHDIGGREAGIERRLELEQQD